MAADNAHAGAANDPPAAPPATEPRKQPPKPRFALTVGIVGHRLKHWQTTDAAGQPQLRADVLDRVERDIRLALEAIKTAAAQAYQHHRSLFARRDPELTLVSALADGADTFAAKAALALGYALDAPLPFAVAEYEKDFSDKAVASPSPLQQFHALIPQARVLELPGQHRANGDDEGARTENRAYEAVGLTVLSQADILLAVWDRKLSRGRGGTAEMVAEAARIGIPIVLVDADGDKTIELRWRGLKRPPAPIVAFDDLPRAALDAGMKHVVDELVRPPRLPEERTGLNRWYGETSHRTNIAIAFALLMDVLGARPIQCGDVRVSQPHELAAEYIATASPAVDPGTPELIANLAEPYGWADAVATRCSHLFRSAFVINFLFAALAVIAGSASVMMMDAQSYWKITPVAIEIVLILCVVGNTWLGRHWRWHHRWVEAREVAERFRAALPLWTLGLRPASFPGEEPTWTGWYTRAMVRMQGLRSGDLNGKDLNDERTVLLNLIKGQRGYNRSSADRMQTMEHRLERAGLSLLVLTVVVALYHLFAVTAPHFLEGPWIDALESNRPLHEATIWLSAALPALATASYGIRVIGDFDGYHQRGERTFRQLKELAIAVKRDAGISLDPEDIEGPGDVPHQPDIEVRQDPIEFAQLRARARTAADAMLGDVSSWRLSAESRGLAIPG